MKKGSVLIYIIIWIMVIMLITTSLYSSSLNQMIKKRKEEEKRIAYLECLMIYQNYLCYKENKDINMFYNDKVNNVIIKGQEIVLMKDIENKYFIFENEDYIEIVNLIYDYSYMFY